MPQSTPERQRRWKLDTHADQYAIDFLTSRGYRLTRRWDWKPPSLTHNIKDEERDAIVYLIEEWDFGGINVEDK